MRSKYLSGRTDTHMEKGAIRRTTCCEFLGCLRRGMRDGSKSGGKYLFKTMGTVSITSILRMKNELAYLYVQTWRVRG